MLYYLKVNIKTNQENRDDFVKELYDFLDRKMKNIIYDGEQLNLDGGVCFTASKIATKILKRLGYNCEVQRVKFIIGNESGKKKFEQFLIDNKPPKYIGKEHVLGLGLHGSHYIIYFKEESLIMDLTIGQASRPEKDMIMKAYFRELDNLPKEIIACKFMKPDRVYELSCSFYLAREYFDKVIKEGYKDLKKGWKK